jgi:hypothetical protein
MLPQAAPVLAHPVPYGHPVHRHVRTVCRSAFAQDLLPLESELPGTFNISDYDHDCKVQAGAVHPLSENKYRLTKAFDVRQIVSGDTFASICIECCHTSLCVVTPECS